MARMLYAIKYLGRYCSECGADGFDIPWCMDFHHRDGSGKSYEVKNKLYNGSFANHKSEIDKCILICSNCHRLGHSNKDRYTQLKPLIMDKLSEIGNSDGGKIREFNPMSLDEKQIIVNMASDGYSVVEISNMMNLKYDRVKHFIRYHKINHCRFERKLPQSAIIKLLNQKHSIRSIAGKIGINRETLRLWISKRVTYAEINGVKIHRLQS
ncbi:helix-turn-helix domain containing protein [Candidatus Pacearchaeota archaeon]|nr:helix-turn-helix domain containing protein [Candidatus Pacearchaeota archaeon]